MLTSTIVLLALLAVLVAYLCLSIGLRLRAEEIRRRAHERQYPGKALDAATLSPRMDQVRQDFAAVAHGRSRYSSFRAAIVASFRRKIMSVSYFCRARREREPEKHDA